MVIFLRNIYSNEQIKESEDLSTLKNYYKVYQKYIAICIGLLSMLNSYNRNDEINTEVSNFILENYPDDTLDELKNCIMQTEIKSALKISYGKVPKFNLKMYAFVYDLLVEFPITDIQYETITTNLFFVNVHRLNKVKIHLHHSHVTGEILRYTHDFCHFGVKENKIKIPMIAHNLFGFDLYYFIKGYVATAWYLKGLKIGGSNLTHINFSNIVGKTKFIDALKYYQKRLAALASTSSDK